MFGDASTHKAGNDLTFDMASNPVPPNLKSGLDLLNKSFSSTHMRNLNTVYSAMEENEKLYGLMTNYEGDNFCWMQPTRIKALEADQEYTKYLRRINDRNKEKEILWDPKPGSDCIAQYEADSHWYRAIIVEQEPDNKWLVLFIDYGNLQTCGVNRLSAPVVESHYSHFHAPTQSLCCRLYNIVPKNPNCRNEIDVRLEQFFTRNTKTFLEIEVRNVRPDFVVDCDIFLVGEDKDENDPNRRYRTHIGQEFVDADLASFADPAKASAIKIPKAELLCR